MGSGNFKTARETVRGGQIMNDFKDGIADALLYGNMRENNISDMYKQGYDFGITIYCQLKEQD